MKSGTGRYCQREDKRDSYAPYSGRSRYESGYPALLFQFTKKELLSKLLDFILIQFKSERDNDFAMNQGNPAGKLHAFFMEKKRSIKQRKKEYIQFDFWVQGTTDPELQEKIQKSYENWRYNLYEVIEEGVRNGDFRADRVDQVPALTVSLLMGGSVQYLIDESAFCTRYLSGRGRRDDPQLSERITRLVPREGGD